MHNHKTALTWVEGVEYQYNGNCLLPVVQQDTITSWSLKSTTWPLNGLEVDLPVTMRLAVVSTFLDTALTGPASSRNASLMISLWVQPSWTISNLSLGSTWNLQRIINLCFKTICIRFVFQFPILIHLDLVSFGLIILKIFETISLSQFQQSSGFRNFVLNSLVAHQIILYNKKQFKIIHL